MMFSHVGGGASIAAASCTILVVVVPRGQERIRTRTRAIVSATGHPAVNEILGGVQTFL